MSQQQIVNYPSLYANGCRLVYSSGTVVSVTAGIIRDSTNTFDMNLGNFLNLTGAGTVKAITSVNAAVVGANGIDTGALANNSFYYAYIIADSTSHKPTAAILSLSATIPTLPFGYDLFRRVGQVLTGGSATILLFSQLGNFEARSYQYDAPLVVVNALGSATAVALSLAGAVPLSAGRGQVILSASFSAATAANSFSLRPTGGTGYPVVVSSPVVTQAYKVAPFAMIPQVLTASTSIDWITSAAGDALTLSVVGYEDYI